MQGQCLPLTSVACHAGEEQLPDMTLQTLGLKLTHTSALRGTTSWTSNSVRLMHLCCASSAMQHNLSVLQH